MKIVPLSKDKVNEAVNLVIKIFKSKEKDRDFPGKWMPASLNPKSKKSKEAYSSIKLSYLKYYLAIDEKTNKVIGTTGVYTLKEDKKNSDWLAWFCVDKKYRGKGYGSKLLDFIIEKARKRNKKYLKLYTSYSSDIKDAIKLYEKRGFQFTKKEIHPDTKEEMIYMKMRL